MRLVDSGSAQQWLRPLTAAAGQVGHGEDDASGSADMIGRHSNILLNPAVERRVIRVRLHWAVLIEPLLKTLGVVLLAYLLSRLIGGVEGMWLPQSLLWYAAVFAVLYFAWRVLEWWVEVIVVTDKRLLRTTGIIVTKDSMMPVTKVTDMSFMRPVIGQILGYGTLRVESAGQKQDLETIEFLPRPDEVFMAISELIFGDKKQPRSHMLEPPRNTRRKRWPRPRWSDPAGRLR